MSPRTRTFLTLTLLLVPGASACDSPNEPNIVVPARTLEAVGDAMQLEALDVGSDRLPTWESLDPNVVTVTRAGMAVAVAPGTGRVVARVGTRSAEGTITVLEPVNVTVSDLEHVVDHGAETLRMRLRNTAGRGYYTIQYWKERETEGGYHDLVQFSFNDLEAQVGMDIVSSNSILPTVPDWVVVLSRAPNQLDYRMTGCIRLDGGTPCPMP